MQYVMSNPKAELAKGKSKLLAIRIQQAAEPIKEFVADLLAKYAAEMSKDERGRLRLVRRTKAS